MAPPKGAKAPNCHFVCKLRRPQTASWPRMKPRGAPDQIASLHHQLKGWRASERASQRRSLSSRSVGSERQKRPLSPTIERVADCHRASERASERQVEVLMGKVNGNACREIFAFFSSSLYLPLDWPGHTSSTSPSYRPQEALRAASHPDRLRLLVGWQSQGCGQSNRCGHGDWRHDRSSCAPSSSWSMTSREVIVDVVPNVVVVVDYDVRKYDLGKE